MESTLKVVVKNDYPNDNSVIDSIWTKVLQALGGSAEIEAGLEAGTLVVEPGSVVSLSKGAPTAEDPVGRTLVTASFAVKGTWAKDA